MMQRTRFDCVCLCYVLVLLMSCSLACGLSSRVLLISLDGFRHDYLDHVHRFGEKTPTFDQLIREGVSVKSPGVTNAFCTKTFPDHYSIVTGLYEEVHGIIASSFYDPVFNDSFSLSTVDIKWWNGTGDYTVVPVWVTNELSVGQNRTSGVFFWPGSEVDGQRPHFFKHYNATIPFRSRVDELVSWFTHVQRPINFGVLYYDEPDSTGHKYGPSSVEVVKKIAELDDHIAYLLDKLKSNNLLDDMNIILTSDHGMETIYSAVILDDFVDSSLYSSYGGTPIRHVVPKPGQFELVYSQLKKMSNVTIYKKEELPTQYHYRDNRRVAPLVIVADVGVTLCDSRNSCHIHRGQHGYNNSLPSMHPIFIARGPAFKKNYVADPFESVDIYPLLCRLLEIQPRLNNGSFERIKYTLISGGGGFGEVLMDVASNINLTMMTFVLSVGFAAMISALWCIGACRAKRFARFSRLDAGWKPLQLGERVVGLKSTAGDKPLLVGYGDDDELDDDEDEEEDFA